MPAAPVIDLSLLTARQGFIIQGDAAGDYAGRSVSSAGDVNGDGIDDLIVGAPYGNDGGTNAGEAYVIYGVAGTRGTVDLSSLAASQGFIIQGDVTYDYLGVSVSSAGDVNGDGIDDLIVGAPSGSDGGGAAGEAYVIYGLAGTRSTVDLTGLAASQGFIIQGDTAGDRAGWSVSSAGDVNGDGIDDLIVGAFYGDDGGSIAGEAYVIYGVSGTRGTVDLTGLAASQGFIIQGDVAGDQAGYSVSSAGDVNGDGIDDLIVGAQAGDNGGTDAGEAYVIYGVAGTRGTVDLSSLAASQGFIIQGDVAHDVAGSSVSSAGDVNGDGIDDLIVGARFGDDGGGNAGEAYVIYGVAGSTRGTVDLTGLAASDGFIIQGDAAGDRAGSSVSSAGDVNGDGIDDMIIGAPTGDDGGGDAGEAYVIYGVAGITRGTVDLTGLAASDGFIIQGDAAGDKAGSSVSSAGDVNGDGIDDLIVGAPGGNNGGSDAGEAYVIHGGSASGFGAVVDLTALQAPYGFIIQGDAAGDRAGWSVSSAGDVNGDGIDDLIVGARYGDDGGSNAGEAYVIYGVAGNTRGTLDLTGLAASDGFVIQGDAVGDWAGFSVSSAGDVNGDGIDDLIVGAHQGDDGGTNAGEAYVIYGVAGNTRTTVDLTGLAASDGFIIQGDAAFDYAGYSVSSAGDVNGDGIDDLIVGAYQGDDGGTNAGEAYVIYGVAGNTRGTLDLTNLSPLQGFIIQGDAAFDAAGRSVSSAGDVNGDGIDDLIVGAPYGDNGGSYAGEAYVIYGRRPTIAVERTGTGIGQSIFGGHLNDTINGMAGDDRIDGGDGADSLDGGTGFDILGDEGGSDAGEAYVGSGTGSAGEALGDIVTGFEQVNGSTFGDTLIGGLGKDAFVGGAGADSLVGGTGVDRASYASSTSAVVVDLGAGTGLGGDAEGDTLNTIENLTGSAHDDRLTGSAGNNGLSGRAGNDTLVGGLGNDGLTGGSGADSLDGGAGLDRASYAGSTVGVVIDLGAGTASGGDATGDVLTSIENLSGSAYADSLTGSDASNAISGEAGNDTILGGLGADTLTGGAGADSLDGGAGVNRASYAGSTIGVVIDLGAGTASGGHATGDVLTAIENLSGSAQADHLTGSDANNALYGDAGNDTLVGGLGNDALTGGAGADSLDGGAGTDRAIYSGSTTGVVIDLGAGTASGGHAANDVLTDIENLTGSEQADHLTGSSGINTLFGEAGNDTLVGGSGNDILSGGTGEDVFEFGSALGAGNIDRIIDFVAIDDQIHLDAAVFTGLATGVLASNAFASNASGIASSSDHRIIYENDTGKLYFDADGNGVGTGIHFATLSASLALSASDFFVF